MRAALVITALALTACGKPADATGKAAGLPDPRREASATGETGASDPFGHWVVASDTSPMDNTVSTRVASISDITTPGADYAAMLIIRCSGPKLEMFVSTDDILDYDSLDGVPVRIRIDSTPAVAEDWVKSDNSRAAFSQEPRALLAKLRSGHRLLLEIPIYGRGRQVASWSLNDLSSHLNALACVKP